MEKSCAGLDALECGTWKGATSSKLRDSLAANAAELAAHHSAGSGPGCHAGGVIRTLEAADAVIHAEKLSLSRRDEHRRAAGQPRRRHRAAA